MIVDDGSQFVNTKAAIYNGVDEHAYRDSPTLAADNVGAFSFWFRPTVVPTSTDFRTIISLGSSTAGNNATLSIHVRWNTLTGSAPKLAILTRRVNGSANISETYGNTVIAAGTLYHIVVQSNGSAWSLYINGVAETLSNFLTSDGANPGHWFSDIGITNKRLSIGARTFDGAADGFFNCKIDEVAYVGRALTGSEITALYNSGTPRNPHRIGFGSDLKSWYRMGDSRDSATTIYDEIGSAHLTLVNMDASNYV